MFHDHDKVTTVMIHILPSWLVIAIRFHTEETDARLGALSHCSAFGLGDYINALLGYAAWQFLYYIKTEVCLAPPIVKGLHSIFWQVVDADYLNKDPSIQTSLRWLALDSDRSIHKLVLSLTRKLRLMGPTEVFDPTTAKTKLIFMASQLAFTAVNLLPVPLLYAHRGLSVTAGLAVFSACVYNG